MTLLHVDGLDAGYDDLQILDSVSLTVEDGEFVSIVGPNGAGKSTVMKSIFGLTTHMAGAIRYRDEDIAGEPPERIVRKGIGYVPQADNVFPGLTVLECLEVGAYVRDGLPEHVLEDVFEQFPVLEDRRDQPAQTLSGGQQQMLAMARALVLEPDLLLLDEPSAGLAPDLVETTFEKLEQVNDAGVSILLVEQNAEAALQRSDRGYVLVQGQNRFEDTGTALLNDPTVREQFLGG